MTRSRRPARPPAPSAGSRRFWGANYPRLLEIKRSRDPGNLLRVRHGVGSEESLPGPAS
jgi:hypothetical protein